MQDAGIEPKLNKGNAYTDENSPRGLFEFNWSSAGLSSIEDWDHALLSAAKGVEFSQFPMLLLIGQEGKMLPNRSMSALLSQLTSVGIAGRSVLDVLPDCAEVLRQVYAENCCSPKRPVLFRLLRESALVWFRLDFTPVFSSDGAVQGIQAVAIEVTEYIERIRHETEAEQRLRLTLESSGMVGIWNMDIPSNICKADVNAARMFGLHHDDYQQGVVHGMVMNAIHEEDRPRVIQAIRTAIATKSSYRCRYRIVGNNKTPRWVDASGELGYGESGEIVRLLGVVIDVTDQMEAAIALKESRFQFEILTEALPHIVWSCDGQGKYDYFSARWSEFTGIQAKDITENTWKELVDPLQWQDVFGQWEEARRNGMPYDAKYRFRHHTGEYRWLHVMALPIRDDDGRITRWCGTATDIHEARLFSAEREKYAQELKRLATEDQLTEVLTRRAFLEVSKVAIENASKQKASIGLMMLDIDHFKSINDTYGHPIGDKVLSVTAKRMSFSISKNDFIGRLGGEEFGILLLECTPEQAQSVAERIRQAIDQAPIILDDGLEISVSISIGVTARVPSGDDLNHLIQIADKSLYIAKTSDRNRSVLLVD